MSSFFGGILIKLFAGGLVCTVVLILTGNSAQREIARLACAAFMIIVIFSSTGNGTELRALASSFNLQDIEIQVDIALENTVELQKKQISQKLADYIEDKAMEKGIVCEVLISYLPGSEFAIEKVEVAMTENATVGQKETVVEIIVECSNAPLTAIDFK